MRHGQACLNTENIKRPVLKEKLNIVTGSFWFLSEKHPFPSCSGNITQLSFSFSSPVLSLYHSTWLWVGSLDQIWVGEASGPNMEVACHPGHTICPTWPVIVPDFLCQHLSQRRAWAPGWANTNPSLEFYTTQGGREMLSCFLYFKM